VPRIRRLLRLAALAGALCLGGRARPAELQLNPIRIELSQRESKSILALTNGAKEPVRVEVKVFAWDESASGEMKLEPTKDVLAFPTLLTIAPGETRNVRVGAATKFAEVEKSYRLFVEELPRAQRADQPAQVQVLSRIGIPVFLSPPKKRRQLAVEGLAAGGGAARFALVSRGNVHARPERIVLVARDGAGATVLEKPIDAWYVLPGGRREYAVELPRDRCRDVRALAVEVRTGPDVVRAAAAVQEACGP
jgi:fimbrial chaperone protein